jgi:ABC-type antimicrobial peptide transport system permease subunit
LTRVALRGLLGRKLRAALTAVAIVLGVAMVSGTFVLTDTIDSAFDQIFAESYAGTDAVVTGPDTGISFQGDTSETPPVPASVLEQVRQVDGVEAAAGSVADESSAKILDRKGKAISGEGAPTFGFGLDTSPEAARFNPLNLLEGRWPRASDEVVIDVNTADDQDYGVGDTVKIASLGPVESFKVVGLARYGDVDSLGTATFAVFDIPTAQRLFDRKGSFDAIQAAAASGVSPDTLAQRIDQAVTEDVTVRTGDQQASEESGEVNDFVKIIKYFLLSFAAIALFVGAFVIFNTMSITVAQRTRELATLRTLGASRRQVRISVLVEALVIGIVASLTGLALGVLLAKGLNALFEALGGGLPTTGLVFSWRTVLVSLLVGVVVTLLAGLFPALRATRVPPISAVREGATLPRGRLAPFVPYIALVVIAVAVALLGYSMFVDDVDTVTRLLAIAAGVVTLFIGVAMISPKAVPPLASFLSPIAKWLMVLLSVLLYPFSFAAWLVSYGLLARGASTVRRIAAGVVGVAFWVALAVLALSALPPVAALIVAAIVLAVAAFFIVRAMRRGADVKEFPSVRPDKATSRLSRENSRRNPGRTAATAAALMIGIALVSFVAVLAEGMKQSNRGAIEDQVKAEWIVTSQEGFTPFVAAAGDSLDKVDLPLVTDVRADLATVAGSDRYLTGIEPSTITQAYTFDWVEGSDAVLGELGDNGAIVDKDFAEDKNLSVGDTFSTKVPSGKEIPLRVAAIYKPPPFYPILGSVSIPKATFDTLYDRPRNQFTFVNGGTRGELESALSTFPDAKLQTREEWITAQDKDFNDFLTSLYVLLALSVIVSIFGMINTLVLSVFERTRELGMLRAVGMTRLQVRRMVRHESVITALIGAALGLPLGMFLAALVTKALSQFEIEYAVPLTPLIIFAIVSVIVGVIAAILPARRASRLNVLEALQYE